MRQRSIALIAFNWSRLAWPRLAARQAGPWPRRMSATSRAGRMLRRYSSTGPAARLGRLRGGGSGARAASILAMSLSPRERSAPSCRASRARATPGSAECPCRPRADGCEGMAQRMKRDRLAQPRGIRRLLEQPAELARRRRVTINATGNNQRCSRATPASRLVGRLFHHCRNRSRISTRSITLRSLRPFDCTMRMII